ncbi:MAG: AAA family ATPase, partial [Planctomycetota bacterium]
PVELDGIERKIMQLEIEKEALKKEKDDASKQRMEKIEKQLSDLREESGALRAQWENEKKAIKEIQDISAKIDQARVEEQTAQREGNLGKVAEIRYGLIRECEQKLKQKHKELQEVQKVRSLLKEEVDADDIATVVAKWTGIPVTRMLEGEKEKLLKMEERLRERVVGQDEAITAVSNGIRRARAGLQDPNRPIGTFLFLGPTGVGKTELCKALASFLFDNDAAMVRIDMSEFMEQHSVARLIGAPPGYVGYEEGGRLTEAIRRRPYAVILFDEIEKAHRDVFNILLQVFDDGRLTDGHGRTVDFKNTIIAMTSNIASQWIQDLTGPENEEELRSQVKQALKESFRPEFLNRIDETIIFHGLTKELIKEVAVIQLKELQKRLARHNFRLVVSDRVKETLVKDGYDPHFGARPLKRTIQQMIENPLSVEILAGKLVEGSEIKADIKNGKIVFTTSGSTTV